MSAASANSDSARALLSGDAAAWLAELHAAFGERFRAMGEGETPAAPDDAVSEQPLVAAGVPGGDWRVPEIPADLRDRRTELHISGEPGDLPADLAAGAHAVVLNLADCLPAGGAALRAQAQLYAAIEDSEDNEDNDRLPAIVFGPRAPGRREPLLAVDGEPIPAALADAGLFLWHAGARLQNAGRTPCLQLPGIRSVADAETWRDLLRFAEEAGRLAPGTVRVTVAINTISAVFDCDAIARTLSDFLVALTFDRPACLQSFIRRFPEAPEVVLPDRAELSTGSHFLHSWGLVMVATAHRHAASAIGPCASYLPPAGDDEARILARLGSDKARHAHDGFDGSGVAHRALLPVVREVFDRLMPGQHQQHRCREDLRITGADLLQVTKGKITESGLRRNIRIALAGLLATRAGLAVLHLDGRRETATSVELAADQLWQWLNLETGILDDGRIIDAELLEPLLGETAADLEGPGVAGAVAQLRRHATHPTLPATLLTESPET